MRMILQFLQCLSGSVLENRGARKLRLDGIERRPQRNSSRRQAHGAESGAALLGGGGHANGRGRRGAGRAFALCVAIVGKSSFQDVARVTLDRPPSPARPRPAGPGRSILL
jgi:hypothetical protein